MEGDTRIEALITPAVQAMGYDVVRVLVSGQQRPVLQVMAERVDGAPMTVDDCADISRALSALLDVEDPITGAYTLEVSSPGIDRPLTRLADFVRFAGFEARVESALPIDGRKRFRGTLMGVQDEQVRIAVLVETRGGVEASVATAVAPPAVAAEESGPVGNERTEGADAGDDAESTKGLKSGKAKKSGRNRGKTGTITTVVVEVPYHAIQRARLVLTDALIAASV